MHMKFEKILQNLKNRLNKFPIKISLLYFLISFLWILLSDNVVQTIFGSGSLRLTASTIKGWIYVIIITVFLYILLNRAMKRLESTENDLLRNYQELSLTHEELEAVNQKLTLSKKRLKQKYDELKISEDRLIRAQAMAHVGNWELDLVKQIFWVSYETLRIFGIPNTSQFISYEEVRSTIHSEDKSRIDIALHQLIAGNSEYDVEFRIIRQNDQQERVVHATAKLEYDAVGIPVKVLGVLRDITEEKQAQLNIKQQNEELTSLYEEMAASDEELKQQFGKIHTLAYKDLVTGLPNRLSLQERLTQSIRASSGKVALLFIDLDNFKYINDSFGHFFGDSVLAEMGKRLTDIIDNNAFVARLGGDEFAIIFSDIEDLEQVNKCAKKLLLNLVTSFRENDISIHISASIGIAVYPDQAGSYEELLKSADTAMYEAKKRGKNQFVIFDQSMNQKLYEKVAMESNLRAAIDQNELMLYYQPVYSLKQNKVHGFEALIRWKSSVYGMVAPSVFIPLAEESGLIIQIGKWVLQKACEYISRLNASRKEKLTISVNISVYQLVQESFVEDVLLILKKNNLDAELLSLEITESILMEDMETNLKKINTLKKYGIKISLDDFGTGYSSLTYLKKLPISILKLDKAFIDDIALNQADSNIVKSIIILANILNLTVIAEGVEEKDQYDCLAEFGCDMIQGYYISKPLPEDEVMKVLD